MFVLGSKSKFNLIGVHPNLIRVVNAAIETGIMDFSVAEGVRSLDRQKKLVAEGRSKTMNSKHLRQSDGFGHAVDLYPYPIDMARVNKNDAREISRFGVLAGVMLTCALKLGVEITSGMDWDGDGQVLDHTFFDAPHFQLKQ